MKKILAIIAAVSALAIAAYFTSSCKPVESGVVMYHVDVGTFNDNYDILRSALDEGFQAGGLTKVPVGTHYWQLEGDKDKCNSKAEEVFLNRCKAIDKNRNLMLMPLALKGYTITLVYTYNGDHDLVSYKFVEENTM